MGHQCAPLNPTARRESLPIFVIMKVGIFTDLCRFWSNLLLVMKNRPKQLTMSPLRSFSHGETGPKIHPQRLGISPDKAAPKASKSQIEMSLFGILKLSSTPLLRCVQLDIAARRCRCLHVRSDASPPRNSRIGNCNYQCYTRNRPASWSKLIGKVQFTDKPPDST